MRKIGRVAGALASALVLGGCWLQPGFVAGHTNWNRDETTITPDNVDELVQVWDTEVDPGAGFLSSPISDGGRLTVSTNNDRVVALDAATGEVLWSRHLPPAFPEVARGLSAPVSFEGNVVVGAADSLSSAVDGARYSLDPVTGADVAVASGYTESLAFADDQLAWVAVQSGGQGTFRVTVDWKYTPALLACPTDCPRPGFTYAIVGDRTLWSRGDEALGYSPACPPVSPGSTLCAPDWATSLGGMATAIAGTGSSALYLDDAGVVTVLDIATGDLRWSADVAGSGIAVADGRVLVGTTDGRLLAFPLSGCGRATCLPTWEGMLGAAGGTPVVGGEVVYVGAGGDSHAFALDGCGAPTCTPLTTLAGATPSVVDDGRVVATAPGGHLVAFALPS